MKSSNEDNKPIEGMTGLQSDIFNYVNAKLIHDLMKGFTKAEIEDRTFRGILVATITSAFCTYHKIPQGDPVAMRVLQFVYAMIFEPIALVMSESIIQRYRPLVNSNRACEDVNGHFRSIGINEPENNVHNLADYVKDGVVN